MHTFQRNFETHRVVRVHCPPADVETVRKNWDETVEVVGDMTNRYGIAIITERVEPAKTEEQP